MRRFYPLFAIPPLFYRNAPQIHARRDGRARHYWNLINAPSAQQLGGKHSIEPNQYIRSAQMLRKQHRYFSRQFWEAETSDALNHDRVKRHIRLARGYESLSFLLNFSLTLLIVLRLFALHTQAPPPDRQRTHHLQQTTATAATDRRKESDE